MNINYLIPQQDLEAFDGKLKPRSYFEKEDPPNYRKALDIFKKWKDVDDGLTLHRAVLRSPKPILINRIRNLLNVQHSYICNDSNGSEQEPEEKIARWENLHEGILRTVFKLLSIGGVPFEEYEDLYYQNLEVLAHYIADKSKDIGELNSLYNYPDRRKIFEEVKKRTVAWIKKYPDLADVLADPMGKL